MTSEAEQLMKQALALPERDRAELADRLAGSLPAGEVFDPASIRNAWHEELGRRLDDLDAGRAKTSPWEDVRQRLEQRFGPTK